jgi:uncharacterized membrane protein
MTLDLLLILLALALALALQPWRAVQGTPPWPALALWALLPLLWSLDKVLASPLLQPLSGACILLWMLGWPLTVLALVPVGLVIWLLSGLDAADALHRVVWLGLVPATLAMGLGAALRRWLPHHWFVYILGRGFFATALALTVTGALAAWLFGVPATVSAQEVVVARLLSAFGDAFLTGMLVSIFVAFRPQWLATYTDRLYLRPPG